MIATLILALLQEYSYSSPVFQIWKNIDTYRYFLGKYRYKVRVATMTHGRNDTFHAILTLLVAPAGK